MRQRVTERTTSSTVKAPNDTSQYGFSVAGPYTPTVHSLNPTRLACKGPKLVGLNPPPLWFALLCPRGKGNMQTIQSVGQNIDLPCVAYSLFRAPVFHMLSFSQPHPIPSGSRQSEVISWGNKLERIGFLIKEFHRSQPKELPVAQVGTIWAKK